MEGAGQATVIPTAPKPKTKTKHLIAGKHIFKWLSTWPATEGAKTEVGGVEGGAI